MEKWFAHRESKIDEIEKEALGYDHATIGALVMERLGHDDDAEKEIKRRVY